LFYFKRTIEKKQVVFHKWRTIEVLIIENNRREIKGVLQIENNGNSKIRTRGVHV